MEEKSRHDYDARPEGDGGAPPDLDWPLDTSVISAPTKLRVDARGSDAARRIASDTQVGPVFCEIENEGTDEGQACAQARSVRRNERWDDRIGAGPAGTTKSGYEILSRGANLSSGTEFPAQWPFNIRGANVQAVFIASVPRTAVMALF